MRARVLKLFFLTVLATWFSGTAPSRAEGPFYEAKTITVIVSFGAGGSYDSVGRLMARHIPKYIPGRPSMIVQNMPGGGGIIASNYLYNRVKHDGLTIALLGTRAPLIPFLRPGTQKYDPARFNYLGSVAHNPYILTIRRDRPWKTLDDLKKSDTPVRVPVQGVGVGFYAMAKLSAELLGLNLKVITGYRGGPNLDLVVERGEVDAYMNTLPILLKRRPEWFKEGFLIPVLQTGKVRHPAFPEVPTLYELAPQAEQLIDLVSGPDKWFGLTALPPEVPADRVKTLRAAFRSLFNDREFVQQLDRVVTPNPTFGEEVQAEIGKISKTPPELIKRLRSLYGR